MSAQEIHESRISLNNIFLVFLLITSIIGTSSLVFTRTSQASSDVLGILDRAGKTSLSSMSTAPTLSPTQSISVAEVGGGVLTSTTATPQASPEPTVSAVPTDPYTHL